MRIYNTQYRLISASCQTTSILDVGAAGVEPIWCELFYPNAAYFVWLVVLDIFKRKFELRGKCNCCAYGVLIFELSQRVGRTNI